MKRIYSAVCISIVFVFGGCTASQNVTAPPSPRVPAKFDFSPPSRAEVGKTDITIAMVRPVYVGKNPEYYIPPFNEMSASMGDDVKELLTAKGFTVRGPFGSRDEMVYNDKTSSSFIFEVGIQMNPQYNTKATPSSKTNYGGVLTGTGATSTISWKTSGEVTLAGKLVINAKSPQYGELLWTKSIALEPASFSYLGTLKWNARPSIVDELNQDNQVYNTLSRELEKFYDKALALAWQQIDPEEMKSVAEQAKKADKKGS